MFGNSGLTRLKRFFFQGNKQRGAATHKAKREV